MNPRGLTTIGLAIQRLTGDGTLRLFRVRLSGAEMLAGAFTLPCWAIPAISVLPNGNVNKKVLQLNNCVLTNLYILICDFNSGAGNVSTTEPSSAGSTDHNNHTTEKK